MSTPVEQIKERLSIIDVIGPYVTLQKAGKNYKGKSPFTNERTPSFFVSPERGMYYCFSSGQGGDMFTFIERMEGVDFKGALKILAERAGVELRPEDPKVRSEREQLYALLEAAAQFFETNLSRNPLVAAYVRERGVTDASVATWRIGYAPDEWRSLKTHLAEQGFSRELMLRSGLIKSADGGKEPYDVFRNRVMFPIADSSGRVVAFSGRRFLDDPTAPKYVNSPETELFVKSEILFGYHKAKSGIRTYDFSLIVEGQFDLVLAHQVGYTNAVAISGTALSPQHIALLQRLSNKAVLALDADAAGVNSVKRSAELMLRRGMDVKVARMQGGKDPADLAKEDPALLKKAVGGATHVVEFLTAILKDTSKDERAFRLRVRDEVVPFIAALESKIDQEYFETRVADAIGTTAAAIHHEVERLGNEREKGVALPEEEKTELKTEPREDDIIAHLFGITLWLATREGGSVSLPLLKKHLTFILGEAGFRELADWPEVEKNKLLFEAENLYGEEGEKVLLQLLPELLLELHRRRLRRSLAEGKRMLEAAERAGESEEAERLLALCAELQKQMSAVEGDAPSFPCTEQ